VYGVFSSDEFIKPNDDVTELEKSIQKLRALLEEALGKLHQVLAGFLLFFLQFFIFILSLLPVLIAVGCFRPERILFFEGKKT